MPGILFGPYVTHFIFVLGGIVIFIWQIKKKNNNRGSENLNNSLANRYKNSVLIQFCVTPEFIVPMCGKLSVC